MKAKRIERAVYWYDRHMKMWRIQLLDPEGNEIAGEYAPKGKILKVAVDMVDLAFRDKNLEINIDLKLEKI